MGKKEIDAMRALLKQMEDEEAKDEAVEAETEAESEDAEKEGSELDEAAKSVADAITSRIPFNKIDRLFDAMEKLEAGNAPVGKMFSAKEVEKDISKMTGNEKIIAFTKALLEDNKSVIKALSEGTAADGGNLFPNEFRFEIIKRLTQTPRMRSLVTVIPMRRDIMDIPSESSKVKVSWGSENTAIATTTADFGIPQLTAYRMNSLIYMSRELVADATEIGVVNLIVGQFVDAVGDEEDKVIIAGTGTGQPTGLTGASLAHTLTVDGNLSFDDLINIFYKLPQQYRNTAQWLLNGANVRELRKLKDSNGQYLWLDSPIPGQPATILGRPVIENAWMPEATIFLGDFKRAYYLGDREQMSVETSTQGGGAWEKHQVSIKVTERIAGITVLTDALASLTSIP